MLKILEVDNKKDLEILRTVSKKVDPEDIKDPSFQQFLDDLIYTVQNTETEEGWDAAGLAAVQVGKPIKVFCILRDSGEFEVMINPEIKEITKDTYTDTEACLSIPHRTGEVERFRKIKISYLDREGNRKRERFSNWEAREIQHEYDHLKGVLFTDKLA